MCSKKISNSLNYSYWYKNNITLILTKWQPTEGLWHKSNLYILPRKTTLILEDKKLDYFPTVLRTNKLMTWATIQQWFYIKIIFRELLARHLREIWVVIDLPKYLKWYWPCCIVMCAALKYYHVEIIGRIWSFGLYVKTWEHLLNEKNWNFST